MAGDVLDGKYSLEREFAGGGMGTLWVAFDQRLKRQVAIKLMHPSQAMSAAARVQFEREAMASARLQNQHVIQIYDYGVTDGKPYLVMELLEGEDLGARLKRQNRLSISATSHIINQVAQALGAAHGVGIIHRDLKPSNIFIARSGSDEIVKLLDFGVSALVNMSPSQSGQSMVHGALVGTPSYMSPEAARASQDLDHRTDLWSLGVVAYRMLSGEPPFGASTFSDLLVKICTEQFQPISQVVPDLGPEVDRFFTKALAKDPAQRFQSASELAGALAALAEAKTTVKANKILFVDDEPDVSVLIRHRLRPLIRNSTYEVYFANNGFEALDQLRSHTDIAVVVTDINMPEMDGLTFLQHVTDVNPLTKVIVLSAYNDMTNVRTAMNRGAFDFLVKPIDFKDLEVTLEKTAKHARELRRTVQSADENRLLKLFVSNGIVDRLLPTMRATGKGASETLNATVAYIGVCDLAEAVGQKSADSSVHSINALFDIIVPTIIAGNGVVDKFIGDALMAVFRGKRHRERALQACVTIQQEIASLAERAGEGSPYAHGARIGVDSGDVVAGAIGSKSFERMDYTTLGVPVNNAVYLSFLAEKNQVLITEDLYQSVHEAFDCVHVGLKSVLGRSDLVAVYNVTGKEGLDTRSATDLESTSSRSFR